MKIKLLVLGLERNPFNDLLFSNLVLHGFDVHVLYTVSSRQAKKNNTYWVDDAPVDYSYDRLCGRSRWRVLSEMIRRRDAVVVFTGYATAVFLVALMVCHILQFRYVVFSDTVNERKASSLWKQVVRGYARKLAFFESDAILSTGGPGRDALIRLGCDPCKIVNFPYVSGSVCFLEHASTPLANEDLIRDQVVGRTVIFFSGQLIYRKGLDNLLYAVSLLKKKCIPFYLLIEGVGCLSEHYAKLACTLNIDRDSSFLGFSQSAEHARYLAISDVVVSPSRWEPWGNIVQEGMLLGKAVIASDQVCSARDRIIDKQNGFLYRVDNVGELALILERVILDADLRRKVGQKAKETADAWRPEVNAINLSSYLHSLT